MNGHVNNAVYVNWALETLPSSTQQRDRSVSELLAFFRNEAGIGQEILSQSVFRQREDSFESLHCLTEKGKAREVLRMKLLWE